ncbi:MAG TPA: hypothetical protein VGW38_08825 [Chloroflexota bacterium]|nr:hypothetical protein [Chloroflexota bacterium]
MCWASSPADIRQYLTDEQGLVRQSGNPLTDSGAPHIPGAGCVGGCLVDFLVALPIAAGVTYVLARFVFHQPLDSAFTGGLLMVTWFLGIPLASALLATFVGLDDDDGEARPR